MWSSCSGANDPSSSLFDSQNKNCETCCRSVPHELSHCCSSLFVSGFYIRLHAIQKYMGWGHSLNVPFTHTWYVYMHSALCTMHAMRCSATAFFPLDMWCAVCDVHVVLTNVRKLNHSIEWCNRACDYTRLSCTLYVNNKCQVSLIACHLPTIVQIDCTFIMETLQLNMRLHHSVVQVIRN